MLVEILVVFVLAAVLGVMLWALFGLLLLPVFGKTTVTLCFAQKDGAALEQQLRAYAWLRDGAHHGGRFLIVDCGLTSEGCAAAALLQKKYPWVEQCRQETLPEYIQLLHPYLEKEEKL